MKKLLPIFIVAILVVGVGSFYGGMSYARNQGQANAKNFLPANFQNLSPEQRQQFARRSGGENLERGFKLEPGAAFLSGEVIKKDNESLTIKLKDGGSKIVFFSASTNIREFTKGSAADLEIGGQVIVNGDENSDGSYTAKVIQIGQE